MAQLLTVPPRAGQPAFELRIREVEEEGRPLKLSSDLYTVLFGVLFVVLSFKNHCIKLDLAWNDPKTKHHRTM